MSTRRIPISQRPPPPPTNPSGAWQSSLDLVFSYSRSNAFFGENLPSGPSFVDSHRYQRPSHGDDSSLAPSTDMDGRDQSEERVSGGRGRGGDGESVATETTTDDEWSGDELEDDGVGASWEYDGVPPPPTTTRTTTTTTREQLPSNAIVRPGVGTTTTGSIHRSGGRSRGPPPPPPPSSRSNEGGGSPTTSSDRLPYSPSTSHSHSHSSSHPSNTLHTRLPPPPTNELTPLLPTQPLSKGLYTPPSTSSPNRAPLLTAPLPSSRSNSDRERAYSRRLSIISSEAWNEAVEEQRGESTYGQTLFNTVNVLIGVGLLAEPLAFADAGWICGTLLLLFCALITNYTGKMLANMMRRDSSLLTYADILIKAYGHGARNFIYLMFILELGALSIALVVLFSDSMETLFPHYSNTFFKILCFFIILPTTFLPLRILSITSLLGIISSFTLLIVLIIDGSLKQTQPGSLKDPMWTSVGPKWMRLPLSFGLLMSGFSGHAVIPSLFRDMKDPKQFNSMINVAYLIAFVISMLFGTLGYLMFGTHVSSEVTRDLILTRGNPKILNKIAVWMVALNPLVKYAIANSPLVQTFETMLGLLPLPLPRPSSSSSPSHQLNGSAISSNSSSASLPPPPSPSSPPTSSPSTSRTRKETLRLILVRPLLTASIVLLSILIPDFARVLSFLGSASAFLICCIGPIGAYLILGRSTSSSSSRGWKRGGGEGELTVKGWERVLCWGLLGVSTVLAGTGTVWAFLPTGGEHHGHGR